jgi:dolichyl-phosphate-mannose-protein mannosyltransferase
VKKFLSRIYRWEFFWLCAIVIITLAMHFSIINQVKTPILDEVYYYGSAQGAEKGDAYSIIHDRVDLRQEHPPLGKLFVVGGIKLFGDNPVGWRVPSITMGTIGIILFFFICRQLNMSRRATNIATFLLGFENFTFLFASIAMLDVFFVTLTLAFFLLYLYRQYVFSGVFIGLAALAKLYAAMAAPVLLIHWIFTKTRQSRWFALTIIMAPISFVAFLPLFNFIITGQFQNPLTRIKDMLVLSGSLVFPNGTNPGTIHPAMARPWEWLLNYRPMAFWYIPHYSGIVNLSIWIVIIPVVLYMIYRAVKGNDAALFGAAWFFSTFVLWIPISIFTNRISFVYYFYPTIGSLCIGLGLILNGALERVRTKTRRIKVPVIALVIAFFVFHVASFVILAPVFFRF